MIKRSDMMDQTGGSKTDLELTLTQALHEKYPY